MAAQKQDDQLERTFSSYVRIQVVVLKTYLGRWTIGRSGERGSGISVLPARYDDDDDLCMLNNHERLICHKTYSIKHPIKTLLVKQTTYIIRSNIKVSMCVCVRVCVWRERNRIRKRDIHRDMNRSDTTDRNITSYLLIRIRKLNILWDLEIFFFSCLQ